MTRLLRLLPLVFLCAACSKGCSKQAGPASTGAAVASDRKLEKPPAAPDLPIELGPSGHELAVVVARPQGTLSGTSRPTITFNKPVVALAMLDEPEKAQGPAQAFQLAPALAGHWHWLGSASVEFVFDQPAPLATEFTVTVPAGATALDGSKLPEPYSFKFQTPSPEAHGMQQVGGFDDCLHTDLLPTFQLLVNQPLADPASAIAIEVGGQRKRVRVLKSIDLTEERRAQEKDGTDGVAQRRFDRATSEALNFRSQETRYEVQPESPLPKGTAYALVVDAGARPAHGTLASKGRFSRSCHTYGPMKITGVTRCSGGATHCSSGPLWLELTEPIGAVAELKSRLSLLPETRLDWSDGKDDPDLGAEVQEDRTRVLLPGRFRAGQLYTIKVAEGLKDQFGQSAPAFETQVQLDDLIPSLYVGRELGLLEAAGDGQLPVQTTNLPKVVADLWPLTPSQYARLRLCDDPQKGCRWPDGPPTSLNQPLSDPRNEAHLHGIDLRAALKGAKTGLVLARIPRPDAATYQNELLEEKPEPLRVLTQLTDLVVHAKVGLTAGAVWVTSAQQGTSVAGAKVQVFDASGAVRAEAVTDQDGVAPLPPLAQLLPDRRSSWEAPRLVAAASQNGDIGVTGTSWGELLSTGPSASFGGLEPRDIGTVFTDRGIYRPGDTVYLRALLRVRDLSGPSGLATPKGEAKVRVVGPGGNEVFSKSVPVSRAGSAGAELVLPREGRLGDYSVQVTLEGQRSGGGFSTYFTVAEYRAPQFRVDVLASSREQLAGTPLEATVSARYLFGGAMKDAQASWSVNRSTTSFEPPKHQGFTFGVQTWGYDEGEPQPEAGFFAGGKGVIDGKGNLTISAGKSEAMLQKPTSYTVEAEVQDVSRQTVANRVTLLVHPAAFYLGLGQQSLFVKAGEPFSVPVVAVTPDGTRVAAQAKVTASVRSWHSVRKKGVGGVYQSVSEMVEEVKATCEVKTSAEPAPCKLQLDQPGFFTLRAEAKDDAGRSAVSSTGVYAIGQGFAAWQRADSTRVELVADKTEYAPGDVAHVLIKSPFPECQALISVEREGVEQRRVQKLAGSTAAIDVPITDEMVPNVFVGAVLQRRRVDGKDPGASEEGDDPGRPAVRAGVLELKVSKQGRRLQVGIRVPKPEWRPRDKVPVEVQVTDATGKPARAEVTLYAVDEGVLRLTDYKVPDPMASMFPARALGVVLGDSLLSLVRKQRFGEKGEVQPGGGGGRGPGGDARSKFLTTVLFTTLETDLAGKANVEIDLPDNLTTFRIMAVALTEADRFGSGESEIRVSLPLLVLPALPRFARTGDAFEAGVVVNAKGLAAEASEVKVSAQLTGPVALAPGQPAEQTVSVREGVAREVRFQLVAQGSGTAKLVFRADAQGDPGRGGPFHDGVEQTLPLQLPTELEAVAVYGDTADGSPRVEGLVAPESARPGLGGLTLTLSSTALGGLGEGMRQLIDYPYGCLEQLSSRLVPFVVLREVQKVFGTGPVGSDAAAAHSGALDQLLQHLLGGSASAPATDPDRVVKETVARIERLQLPSGGFTYWPGFDCPTTWSSIYATLALHRSREVGYPVTREVFDRARRFLVRVAEGQKDSCQRFPPMIEERIFALQVLARIGEPRPALYDELFAQKDKLSLFSKAQLADAMVVGKGKRPKAQVLLDDLLAHAEETAGEIHFAEKDAFTYAPLFSSDTRTTGMVLQTLVDLQPGHPFVGKIARYFNSVRRGGAFRNTQEAAYALMGLAEVVRAREREVPDFTGKVSLGGKELASAPFQGRSLDPKVVQVPLDQVIAASKAGGKKGAPFTFAAEGKGILTYGARLTYAPAELPMKPRDEGLFVQSWFEPYDSPGKAATEFLAGELVRVRVRIATRAERHFVAVDVPLPAGLEAVDLGLATSAKLQRARGDEPAEGEGEEGYDDQGRGASEDDWGFWSPFDYSEKRDDRVVYFSSSLPPGVHVQSFIARATTPGKFLLRPAKAEEMYTPEVFGRSEGGTVTVVARQPLSQK